MTLAMGFAINRSGSGPPLLMTPTLEIPPR
jgi:hypothetical protein